jgi:toxin ParE1/3/4
VIVSRFANSHQIRISAAATKDILEIYDYVVEFDSEANADRLIAKIKASINTLANFPERGSIPNDLVDIGIRDYRQIFFKPYRIIYLVNEKFVTVNAVLDGRRNLQTLLSRRLLRL